MTSGDTFTVAGYLTGVCVYLWAGFRFWPQQRLSGRQTIVVLIAGLMGGLAGSKAVQLVLLGWQAGSSLALGNPNAGGRTILGGLVVGWMCVEAAKWCLGVRTSTGGPFALAIPAGESVGRIGCFFNACCYGAVSNLPQGLPFTVEQHGAWRVPAQLLSSLGLGLLFAFLLVQSKSRQPADLFRLFLVTYGILRFMLEFARHRNMLLGGLSIAQWVCLELALAGATAIYISRRGDRLSTARRPR